MNSAEHSGVININEVTGTIFNSVFVMNNVINGGGAIHSHKSNITMEECTFDGNGN